MVEIIEQVGTERMARRASAGFSGPGYFRVGNDGRLVDDLNSNGEDTEYDSMDLMVSSGDLDREVLACRGGACSSVSSVLDGTSISLSTTYVISDLAYAV